MDERFSEFTMFPWQLVNFFFLFFSWFLFAGGFGGGISPVWKPEIAPFRALTRSRQAIAGGILPPFLPLSTHLSFYLFSGGMACERVFR